MRRRVYASLFSGACRFCRGARLPLRPHRGEGGLRGAHPRKGADGAALGVGGPHGAAAAAPAPPRGGGDCRQQRGDAARRPRSRLLLSRCPDSRGGFARVPLGAAQHAAAARRDAAAGDARGRRLRPCPRPRGRAQGPPRPGAIARLGPTLQPGGGDAAHVPEADPPPRVRREPAVCSRDARRARRRSLSQLDHLQAVLAAAPLPKAAAALVAPPPAHDRHLRRAQARRARTRRRQGGGGRHSRRASCGPALQHDAAGLAALDAGRARAQLPPADERGNQHARALAAVARPLGGAARRAKRQAAPHVPPPVGMSEPERKHCQINSGFSTTTAVRYSPGRYVPLTCLPVSILLGL
mmetsp:Transcript_8053/g.26367  ORF Transcript_8053/g.26367 Transcript_8053/m.26367 type:complete len:354 (+) Transcript_8053:238-1299(+)